MPSRNTKSTVNRVIAILALTLSSVGISFGSEIMSDPWLGLKFRVGEKKWEEVSPAEAVKMELRDGPWWVFGSYEENGGHRRFLLLSGMTRQVLDTEPETYAEPAPDFGFIMEIEKGQFTPRCVANALDVDWCGVPKNAQMGLIDDFVARAVRACGGRKGLQDRINGFNRHPWMEVFVAEGLIRAGFTVPDEMVMYDGDGTIYNPKK